MFYILAQEWALFQGKVLVRVWALIRGSTLHAQTRKVALFSRKEVKSVELTKSK